MTYSSFAIRDVTTDVRGDAGLVIRRCSALFIMPFVTTYTRRPKGLLATVLT
jgi:hypothetical protein